MKVDTVEFIEIYNVGDALVMLLVYMLKIINGSGGVVLKLVDLSDFD